MVKVGIVLVLVLGFCVSCAQKDDVDSTSVSDVAASVESISEGDESGSVPSSESLVILDEDLKLANEFKTMLLSAFEILNVQVVAENGMFGELEYVELDQDDRVWLDEIRGKIKSLFDASAVYLKTTQGGSEEERAAALGKVHSAVADIQEMGAGSGLNVLGQSVRSVAYVFGSLIDTYDKGVSSDDVDPGIEEKIVSSLNLFKTVFPS
jgi:hypothetical protein